MTEDKKQKLLKYTEAILNAPVVDVLSGHIPEEPARDSSCCDFNAEGINHIAETPKMQQSEDMRAFFEELNFFRGIFGKREVMRYDELVDIIGKGAEERIAHGDEEGMLVVYGVRINRTVACRGLAI